MQYSQIPTKIGVPWASGAGGGYITNPPVASQIGINNGRASFTDGFPPLNFLPVGAGGTPPFGQDMNGILNQITLWTQWQSAGALTKYDATFSSTIGGYPFGAIVASTTAGIVWICTADNNTSNPDTGGANWVSLGGNVSSISFGVDTGSANVMSSAPSPAPSAYNDGAVYIIIKTNVSNTGAMTGNVNGLGSRSITMPNGGAVPASSWAASAGGIFVYQASTTSLIFLNPIPTGTTGWGISVSTAYKIAMDIANMNAPSAAINLNDLIPVFSLADAQPVKQTISAILSLAATVGAAGRILSLQLITSTGNYTKSAGVNKALVFATGGGGGGGGDPSTQTGQSGYGAAAGGTAIALVDVSALSTVACTIGAGGAGVAGGDGNAGQQTSFGTYAIATGGAGGWNAAKVNTTGDLSSPTGGVGTAGLMLLKGQDGGAPPGGGTPIGNLGGTGGASFWGAGGGGNRNDTGSPPGKAGGNYGGGGGGGDRDDTTPGTNAAGGTGGPGVIFIIELS